VSDLKGQYLAEKVSQSQCAQGGRERLKTDVSR
jgi:hypothetical protein